jgi:hypothetical protein
VDSPTSNIISLAVPSITNDSSMISSPVGGLISSVAPSITDTTLSSVTAPAETVFSPDNPGSSTHGTNSGVQREFFFSAHGLAYGISSPVRAAVILPQDVNVLPPPVCSLICPPRPEVSLQVNPAHVSESVSSSVTAPVMATVSPSALAATLFRDTWASNAAGSSMASYY